MEEVRTIKKVREVGKYIEFWFTDSNMDNPPEASISSLLFWQYVKMEGKKDQILNDGMSGMITLWEMNGLVYEFRGFVKTGDK